MKEIWLSLGAALAVGTILTILNYNLAPIAALCAYFYMRIMLELQTIKEGGGEK